MNYRESDDLFTDINFPAQYGLDCIRFWVSRGSHSSMRYIYDEMANLEYLNIKQKLELYPGVKTFSCVINPYQRMAFVFTELKIKLENNIENNDELAKLVDLESFDSFLISIPKETLPNFWFSLITPQKQWLIQDNYKTDYIFRFEKLEEELAVFQEYFYDDTPLIRLKPHLLDIDYKSFYNSKTKKIIENYFKEDLEYFGYKF